MKHWASATPGGSGASTATPRLDTSSLSSTTRINRDMVCALGGSAGFNGEARHATIKFVFSGSMLEMPAT